MTKYISQIPCEIQNEIFDFENKSKNLAKNRKANKKPLIIEGITQSAGFSVFENQYKEFPISKNATIAKTKTGICESNLVF